MSKLLFATWFKGSKHVGYIVAKDEEDLKRICKRRYSGKLDSWKSLGKFKPKEKSK